MVLEFLCFCLHKLCNSILFDCKINSNCIEKSFVWDWEVILNFHVKDSSLSQIRKNLKIEVFHIWIHFRLQRRERFRGVNNLLILSHNLRYKQRRWLWSCFKSWYLVLFDQEISKLHFSMFINLNIYCRFWRLKVEIALELNMLSLHISLVNDSLLHHFNVSFKSFWLLFKTIHILLYLFNKLLSKMVWTVLFNSFYLGYFLVKQIRRRLRLRHSYWHSRHSFRKRSCIR